MSTPPVDPARLGRSPLDREGRSAAAALRRRGLRADEAAEVLGVGRATMLVWLLPAPRPCDRSVARRDGTRRYSEPGWTLLQELDCSVHDAVVELYADGMSTPEIASVFGVTAECVRRRLNRAALTERHRGAEAHLWPRERIELEIRRHVAEAGRAPRLREMPFSAHTVRSSTGMAWVELLTLLGHRTSIRWTRALVVERLRCLARELGRAPSRVDLQPLEARRRGLAAAAERFERLGLPNHREVVRVFGSLGAAVEAAGIGGPAGDPPTREGRMA